MDGNFGLEAPNRTSTSGEKKVDTKGAERNVWSIEEVGRCLEDDGLNWHDATLSVRRALGAVLYSWSFTQPEKRIRSPLAFGLYEDVV